MSILPMIPFHSQMSLRHTILQLYVAVLGSALLGKIFFWLRWNNFC